MNQEEYDKMPYSVEVKELALYGLDRTREVIEANIGTFVHLAQEGVLTQSALKLLVANHTQKWAREVAREKGGPQEALAYCRETFGPTNVTETFTKLKSTVESFGPDWRDSGFSAEESTAAIEQDSGDIFDMWRS